MKRSALTLGALAVLVCACSNRRSDDGYGSNVPSSSTNAASSELADPEDAGLMSEEEANRQAEQKIREANADAEYDKLVKELEGGG